MKNYVTCEFDSVDLADLAIGRIKGTPGISDIEINNSRFDTKADEYDKTFYTTPIMPFVNGLSYGGVLGYGSFFNFPSQYNFDKAENGAYEPAERHGALLKAKLSRDCDGKKVLALLCNIGGRNIRFISE